MLFRSCKSLWRPDRASILQVMVQTNVNSEEDFQLIGQPRPSAQSWKKIIIGVSASLALCGAVARLSYARGLTAATDFESKFQVVTAPSRAVCSKTTQDCYNSGCCSVEGYTCFETDAGKAKCMKQCNPKKFSCVQRTNSGLVEARVVPSQSMYCFVVIVVDTGGSKPTTEVDLMNHQSEKDRKSVV